MQCKRVLCWAFATVTACCSFGFGQETAATASATFAPLDQWKEMIVAGNAAGLKNLYSTSPAARITTRSGEINTDTEIQFWLGLKVQSMKLQIMQSAPQNESTRQLVLQAEIVSAASGPPHTVYVSEGQLWQQQDGQWRIVMAKRTEPARLQQPTDAKKNIYPPGVNAHDEIKEAIEKAGKEHKRVILVFGANWCYDCHVLDMAFHRADIAPILSANYEVVHVDVGEGDKNQDLMNQYEVPMKRGIPGLAVLDSGGKLVYSQKNGEFENARSLAPDDLLAFLNKWKTSPGQ